MNDHLIEVSFYWFMAFIIIAAIAVAILRSNS